MANSYQHVYLSPHYDDVSLSCGGTVHRQTQAGETVLVVTVCAAPPAPGEPLSPLTQSLHARWGDPADVVATRRAEDQVSVAILGADFQRLDFKDCIYRGRPQAGEWYYNSDADIFGTIYPAEKSLSDEITQAVIELVPKEKPLIYAPLSVGHHVDHQLTHVAAWQLHQVGYTVSFYEDYPYADPEYRPHDGNNLHPLQTTLAALQTAKLQPQLRFLSEANLVAKIDSIRAYASQLEMLFGTDAKMAARVRNYALQVGAGQLAERIWRL